MAADSYMVHHEGEKPKKRGFLNRLVRGYSNIRDIRHKNFMQSQERVLEREQIKTKVAKYKYKTGKYRKHTPSGWEAFGKAVVGSQRQAMGESPMRHQPSHQKTKYVYVHPQKQRTGKRRSRPIRREESYESYDKSLGDIDSRLRELL
jgi:hypothetical protein